MITQRPISSTHVGIFRSMRTILACLTVLGGATLSYAATNTPDWAALAVTQMGGNKLAAINTLSEQVELKIWSTKQSRWLTSEPLLAQEATVAVSQDLQRDFARLDWNRRTHSPRELTFNFAEVLTPNAGWVSGPDGFTGVQSKEGHAMSGVRLTTALRELERLDVLREMAKSPSQFKAVGNIKFNNKAYPAVEYTGHYGHYIVGFDSDLNLPVIIRTRDWDGVDGDSSYDLRIEGWATVDGIKWPSHYSFYLNSARVMDVSVSDVKFNPTIDSVAFTIPTNVLAQAPKAADPATTPFQWVLWQQYFGTYYDTDHLYYLPGEQLKLVDVAQGVTAILGGSHNAMIIETPKYLALVDCPVNDEFGQWLIEQARKKYPGKPIKYLLLSHAHEDHIGGLRSVAALGVTIVVGKGLKPEVEHMLSASTSLDFYAPNVKPKAKVIEVDGKLKLTDGGREIDAYNFDTPHAGGNVAYNIPDVGVAFTTDVNLTANGPNAADEVRALRKQGVTLDKIVEGHRDAIINYADIVKNFPEK